MSDDDSQLFSFLGKFFVPSVYYMKINNEKTDIEAIRSLLKKNLPTYEPGNPGNPGSGFEVINIDFDIDLLKNDLEILEIAKKTIIIGYILEKWSKKRVFKDGSWIREDQRSVIENYLFWHVPNICIIRGSKFGDDRLRQEVGVHVAPFSSFEKRLTFDPDFFVWLVWKKRCQENLESDMKIGFMKDLGTTGDEDLMGGEVEARKSLDATKSLPILICLLHGKRLSNCEVSFDINNRFGTLKVNSNGRIEVIQSLGDLKYKTSIERAFLGYYFINRLQKLYEKWKKLNLDLRYPPDTFFHELVSFCKEEGIGIYSNVTELIDEYERKRTE